MKFLVVAYPEIPDADFKLIQDFRRQHDALNYKLVLPHFTLVFAVEEIAETIFLDEVKKQLAGFSGFQFTAGHASLHKDDFKNYFHAFLVPGDGYRVLVQLHDKLYSEQLSIHLRKDIPYIPHIGIGNSTEQAACEKMVEEWNARELRIRGTVKTIDVIRFDGQKIYPLEKIALSEFAS